MKLTGSFFFFSYKRAEKTLSYCKATDSDEEIKCKELLLKLYINLCVCYNHPNINTPEKVCSSAKAAMLQCTKEAGKSAKLFFK